MSETPQQMIDRQIAELEASLSHPLPEAARRLVEQQLAALRGGRAAPVDLRGAQFGDLHVGDVAGGDLQKGLVNVAGRGRFAGLAVGINLGTVVYGRDPSDDERRRLTWYLEGLAAKLAALPLHGLDERLGRGPGLPLGRAYTPLATETRVEVARGPLQALRPFFEGDGQGRQLKAAHSPDHALPNAALFVAGGAGAGEELLERAQTAAEAVRRHGRLALLGGPGSGKSTFLRHLAWALALRGLDPRGGPAIPGLDDVPALLPILVPLRALAGRLARERGDGAVFAALRDAMHAFGTHQVDDALAAALSNGAVLLLFDGLDEVPAGRTPDQADRPAVLHAVAAFARRYAGCRAVLTCRAGAFGPELQALLGWPAEALAELTGGQIRHFAQAWFGALAAAGQVEASEADRLSARLVAAALGHPRLRPLAGAPLLLTAMALTLTNNGALPRDRPQLYERILALLLGGWDQARELGGIGQAIGAPGWDGRALLPLLDRLAYRAHAGPAPADGRGPLSRGEVYAALADFFQGAGADTPGDAARRCLDYLEQRSGLLRPEGGASLAFAHLALQEHCAGRALALGADDPVARLLSHRHDERWREPIMLGAGLATPLVLDRLLGDLVEHEEGGAAKPAARWHRDLVLAAEIGADRGWDELRRRPQVRAERWRAALRAGLAALLSDPAQPLPSAERVRAGFLFGDLGDPRLPLTLDEWRGACGRAAAGDGGYFCPIPQGEGGAARWIGRYPATNGQLREWLRATGRPPWPLADDPSFGGPNQPAAGVSWLLATSFCAWLSEQLGVTIRLPSEAEWAAAAYGDDGRLYPWGSARLGDRAAIKDDLERRGWPATVPVGCYPAGASAAGALDMAGNVWEWTADPWRADPGSPADGRARVLRGGCYRSKKAEIRATARIGLAPNLGFTHGFRVVLELGERAPGA